MWLENINKTKTGNVGCIFQGIVVPDRLDLTKVSKIQSTSRFTKDEVNPYTIAS